MGKYEAYDLGALTSHLPPPFSTGAMVVTNGAIYAVLLTVNCSYTNLMAGALATAMGEGPEPAILHCIIVTVLILPLCFCNQEYLKFSSGVTVVVTLYIFVLMVMQPKNTQGACVVGIGKGFLSMSSVMMQAIVIQMCVLPMYKELQDRTPKRFDRAVQISFTALFVIYAAFSVVGYLTYGPGVNSNILNSLGSDAWGKSGRIIGGFSVVGIYPVLAQSMVAPIWNSEHKLRLPCYGFAMVVTVSIPMIISFFIHSLGALNVFSGAIQVIAFVGFIPAVVGYFLRKRTRSRVIAYTVLFLVSLAFGIASFFLNDNHEADQECSLSL